MTVVTVLEGMDIPYEVYIPPQDHRLFIRGTRYSAIPIMSMQGIHDVQLFEGTVNGDMFEQFIRDTLLPILNPFNGTNPLSVVIMNNCSIHHVDQVIDLIENTAKARVIFLPDLMPLEEVFSKIKYTMKANDDIFQTSSTTRTLITMAFSSITNQDCLGYIQHSGYIH